MKNYIVDTTNVTKHIITISRKQLWMNYSDCWRDMIGDSPEVHLDDPNDITRVIQTLCAGPMDATKIRNRFRQGLTCMLMGDAMQFIDNGVGAVYEIVVTDGDQRVVVGYEDINF